MAKELDSHYCDKRKCLIVQIEDEDGHVTPYHVGLNRPDADPDADIERRLKQFEDEALARAKALEKRKPEVAVRLRQTVEAHRAEREEARKKPKVLSDEEAFALPKREAVKPPDDCKNC